MTDLHPIDDSADIEDDGREFIGLADTDEWADFWAANREALEAEVGDEDFCFRLACNCGLLIGGGAAPAFRVGFTD